MDNMLITGLRPCKGRVYSVAHMQLSKSSTSPNIGVQVLEFSVDKSEMSHFIVVLIGRSQYIRHVLQWSLPSDVWGQ